MRMPYTDLNLCVKLKGIKLSKALLVTASLNAALLPGALADQVSQVLFMVENKRLEASICPDSMNRITVANDRIVQVFGDEGAFESQSEENTGQVFIKPTAENSIKPLSLTLITEQGKTQDLSLKPTAKSAATLILKTSDKAQKTSATDGSGAAEGLKPYGPSLGTEKNMPVQEQMLTLLKQAVSGQLPLKESGPSSRPSPEGYSLAPYQSFQGGGYEVQAYHLENTTPTPIDVQEKTFYRPGDLAISIQARVLASHGKTLLYVVRREGEMGA
jgi:type-F conjugative transfer system secretin TraK